MKISMTGKMLRNFKKIKLEREYDVAPWIHCCNLLAQRMHYFNSIFNFKKKGCLCENTKKN